MMCTGFWVNSPIMSQVAMNIAGGIAFVNPSPYSSHIASADTNSWSVPIEHLCVRSRNLSFLE